MKTPSAEGEDIPNRVIALELHLVEVMELERCVQYFCEHAPSHFDCASHAHRMRDVIRVLRASVEAADPEYAKQMFDKIEERESKPARTPREIHHHYHRPTPAWQKPNMI